MQSDVGARNISLCARISSRRTGLALAAAACGGAAVGADSAFDAGTGEVWMRFNTHKMQILPRRERELNMTAAPIKVLLVDDSAVVQAGACQACWRSSRTSR